jgi:predicted MFS family arabinose efflux permease
MNNNAPTFYGWRIVHACLFVAFIAWSFALYGPSVYIYALSETHQWPVGSISTALTFSFLINAFVVGFVGTIIGRYGPQVIMAVGATLMATGIVAIGQITQPWQTFIAFPLMGLGWSCLSTIAVSATIAPWFERYQGQAISTALLGASLGGMLGIPITLLLVSVFGFAGAMMAIGLIVVASVVPISLLILRRRPHDLGQQPDGLATDNRPEPQSNRPWTRAQALETFALRSTIVTFGIALMVQVGFLSHQVTLLQGWVTPTQTAMIVFLSGALAFLGRVLLARVADRLNIRLIAGAVLMLSAIGLTITATADTVVPLVIGILLFGFNVGNLTTLPALIVRREFGAPSFGKVFGITGTFMQLISALGPAAFGLMHNQTSGYSLAIGIAAILMVLAAALITAGQWRSRAMT